MASSNFAWRDLDPIENASRLKGDISTLSDPYRGVGTSRDWLKLLYGVDDASLAEVRGRTVHIWPWEAGVAWAYELDWRPLPVFQSYSAYTPDLDELNRKFLASDRAPERILRHQTAAIDGRLLQFDSPAGTVETLCRYVQVRATTGLQVLARTEDRCDEPVTVDRHGALRRACPRSDRQFGHDVVFARVHGAGPSPYERLRTLVYKLDERRIILNGTLNYRFVPGTATGPQLMHVPRAADYSGEFRLSPDATSVAVDTGDDRTIGYEFFRMRIRGAGVRPPSL